MMHAEMKGKSDGCQRPRNSQQIEKSVAAEG